MKRKLSSKGIKLMVVISIAILFVLYFYRCPPMSQMEGQTYFMTSSGNIKDQDLRKYSSTLDPVSNLEVRCKFPTSQGSVPIYKTQVDTSFFLSILHSILGKGKQYSEKEIWSNFYEIDKIRIESEKGNAFFYENGIFSIHITDTSKTMLNDAASKLQMDLCGEMSNKAFQINGFEKTIYNKSINGIPLSSASFPDNRRLIAYPQGAITVVTDSNGEAWLNGIAFDDIEIINKNCSILSSEYCLSILDDYLKQTYLDSAEHFYIAQIQLEYQPYYIRGEEKSLFLIPVWSYVCNDQGVRFYVDAVTSKVLTGWEDVFSLI